MWTANDWELIESCFACQLSSEELLGWLPLNAREDWTRLCRRQRIAKGDRIFTEGEDSRGIYLLRVGKAEISISQSQEARVYLRRSCANEVLGLTATLAGWPYEMNAEAITSCDADFVARDDFLRFLRTHTDICNSITQYLSQKLTKVYQQFSRLQTPQELAKWSFKPNGAGRECDTNHKAA